MTSSCVHVRACMCVGVCVYPFYAAAAVCFVCFYVVNDSCFVADDDFKSQADSQLGR